MVDPRCRVKRVSGFSSAHFSFALHTFGRLSDHGISSSRKSVVLSSMYRIPLASAPFFVAEICQLFFPTQNFLMLRSQAYADIRIRCVMPDFMKLLSGGIKKGEGNLISQIKSMAAKVQQGIEGISSFSLPELTLPYFDGSGWNFPQAALAGGGTTRTTNLGGVYITVNGYNARNDDELAQIVADKINGMIHEDDSVFK